MGPLLRVLCLMLIVLFSETHFGISETNMMSTEKQTSSTLATTMTSYNVSGQKVGVFVAKFNRKPTSVRQDSNSGWKGFAVADGVPLLTDKSPSTTVKSPSTTVRSPDLSRVFYDFSTPFPLPPIYRPKYPNDEPPEMERPSVYAEPKATTTTTTTTSASPPYYSYFMDVVTNGPTKMAPVPYATKPPSNNAPYPSYVYVTTPPTLRTPLRSYASNAIMGKSYGGSGGGISSYGSMGMGMGSAAAAGMSTGSGMGAGMHGYDTSYMQPIQPSQGGGMMYGSGVYGSGGAAAAAPAAAAAGMMPYGGYIMPAAVAKEESSLKGFINKLLAFLPIGLLLAVALPSLVVVPGRRSLDNEDVDASSVHVLTNGSNVSYPMLDMIDYYGVDSLRDEKCFQYILCKTVRLGSQHGANLFQEQLWGAINWMDVTLAKSMGIDRLWSAILQDECATFSCTKRAD